MLATFLRDLFRNSEVDALADSLAEAASRWAPRDAIEQYDPAAIRRINTLLNGLAARAARHREEHEWGIFGKGQLCLRLRKKLSAAGYDKAFVSLATTRIVAPL